MLSMRSATMTTTKTKAFAARAVPAISAKLISTRAAPVAPTVKLLSARTTPVPARRAALRDASRTYCTTPTPTPPPTSPPSTPESSWWASAVANLDIIFVLGVIAGGVVAVSHLSHDASRLEHDVQYLEKTMDENFTKQRQRLDAKLAAHSDGITGLEKRLGAMFKIGDDKLAAMDKKLDMALTRLLAFEQRYSVFGERLATLEEKTSST